MLSGSKSAAIVLAYTNRTSGIVYSLVWEINDTPLTIDANQSFATSLKQERVPVNQIR